MKEAIDPSPNHIGSNQRVVFHPNPCLKSRSPEISPDAPDGLLINMHDFIVLQSRLFGLVDAENPENAVNQGVKVNGVPAVRPGVADDLSSRLEGSV